MQEFVYALTFITAARNYTVSVGVPTFLVHGDVYFWGSLMAGCVLRVFRDRQLISDAEYRRMVQRLG